jgi:Helix-loop-helix DNA-binding domain
LEEKKRIERNSREKQRSMRINKQIEHLKELLITSGVNVRSELTNQLMNPIIILFPLHNLHCIHSNNYFGLTAGEKELQVCRSHWYHRVLDGTSEEIKGA